MTVHTACFNHLGSLDLPEDCVFDCSHQGPCDADVEYWQPKLNLQLDRDGMLAELAEYGAWEDDELASKTDAELEQIVIWIAAGNIRDELRGAS
jgi:hypothetical protein